MTRESVLKQITSLMNNHEDRAGGGKNEICVRTDTACMLVLLYYIGAGKRNTGDWCFEDGFITFKDLTDLYLQLLRGRVLTIVTDCSHSGCWVKQCMTFLDEQGVGPCGHSARDKGILINVYASCLSHQVPRQLVFSVHTCRNDKNTGDLIFHNAWDCVSLQSKIADGQHMICISCTVYRGEVWTRLHPGQVSVPASSYLANMEYKNPYNKWYRQRQEGVVHDTAG